jgi:U3 small nucleolar RNA-associated protein 13
MTKVWALTVSRDNKTIISGAADSVVTFWEDCTEEQEAARESARAELVLKYVSAASILHLMSLT